MKKFYQTIIMVIVVSLFSGCATTGTTTGSNSNNGGNDDATNTKAQGTAAAYCSLNTSEVWLIPLYRCKLWYPCPAVPRF